MRFKNKQKVRKKVCLTRRMKAEVGLAIARLACCPIPDAMIAER